MASRLNDNQLNSRFIDQIFARLRKLIVSDDGVDLLQGYCHIVGLLGVFAGVADQHPFVSSCTGRLLDGYFFWIRGGNASAVKGRGREKSNINGIYPQIKSYLKNNRYVLFVGTPCQVEGLNLYLRKPYDTLITADLVCHAVPSPLIFREYIAFVNKKMKAKCLKI